MGTNTRRLHRPDPGEDQREVYARDHDRVLYSPEFKRLEGVTQVASAAEGHSFHNRLTHSLKVSQLARRLAEFLREPLTEAGWPDGSLPIPECAAAAGLAHDLGHPPFGHVAENKLNQLVQDSDDDDGFEGNAQSFRIVTRLSAHRPEYPGLDLTPRTLNAILKYPWTRDSGDLKRSTKFGVYRCDVAAFEWVRSGAGSQRSLDAQIMDVADEIAYGVHDLEDFWKAGLIPVDRLRDSDADFEAFIKSWKDDPSSKVASGAIESRKIRLREFLRVVFPERVGRTFLERASLNRTTSVMIGELFRAVKVTGTHENSMVEIAEDQALELRFLQRLTWNYVIQNPRLVTQQAGQRRVVEELFDYYLDAAERNDTTAIPSAFIHLLEADRQGGECTPARLAADIVAGLGDAEATALFGRLTGVRLGSILDQVQA